MYILLLVFSVSSLIPGPSRFSVQEFSSKESCRAALEIAKDFYQTVDKESKCVSVKEVNDQTDLKAQVQTLKKKIRDIND
jgi:hypothetical protein